MATIDNARLSHLIDRVYGASISPETWPAVLRELAGTLNAKSGLLRTLELNGGRTVLASHHHNLDPDRQADYCAHFVGSDPYLEELKRFPPGRMVSNEELLDLNLYRHTPFYQHYFKPLDNHFIVGGYVERQGGLYTILGLHRHSRAHPFGTEDLDTIQLLAPHIRRSVQLQRRLAHESQRATTAERALDALGVAAFVLDREGRVLHANPLGERLCQPPNGLRIGREGRLAPRNPNQDRAFTHMVEQAVLGAGGASLEAADPLLVDGPGTDSPKLLATGYPVSANRQEFRDVWPEAWAIIYVGDLDDTGLLRPEALSAVFELTPAQGRVAVAIARGRDLPELAEDWAVSIETLRSHLKAVFAKTGVRRQSELVRLLAGAPWKLVRSATTPEPSP